MDIVRLAVRVPLGKIMMTDTSKVKPSTFWVRNVIYRHMAREIHDLIKSYGIKDEDFKVILYMPEPK